MHLVPVVEHFAKHELPSAKLSVHVAPDEVQFLLTLLTTKVFKQNFVLAPLISTVFAFAGLLIVAIEPLLPKTNATASTRISIASAARTTKLIGNPCPLIHFHLTYLV